MKRGDFMLFDRVDIAADGDPATTMFSRWRLVQTPWFGLWLHRHNLPELPVLHDHPRPFLSVVLRGGYWERLVYSLPPRHVARFNYKQALDSHYIHSLDRNPTWTLVLAGRRQRTWGYTDTRGDWVPYTEHPLGARFADTKADR